MLIVVDSPYRESETRSRAQHAMWARELCRAISLAGHEPSASHLFGPLFLDEDVPAEREAGIRIQKKTIERCDELWVWDLWGISGGMRAAIDHCTAINAMLRGRGLPQIPIRYASKGECPAWITLLEVEALR